MVGGPGYRAGHFVDGRPERDRAAAPVGLAPRIGDGPTAFPALGQAIIDAIPLPGRDDEDAAVGCMSAPHETEAERRGEEIAEDCRPRSALTHAETLDWRRLKRGGDGDEIAAEW